MSSTASGPRMLLIQGANMAYLGQREPEVYGRTTAAELDGMLAAHARERGVQLEILYTHIEGEAIGRIYQAVADGVGGLVMNPAGFAHAGYALRDCLRAVAPRLPYVEVHMSNIEARGITSVMACAARGTIAGFGVRSYVMGFDALLEIMRDERAKTGAS